MIRVPALVTSLKPHPMTTLPAGPTSHIYHNTFPYPKPSIADLVLDTQFLSPSRPLLVKHHKHRCQPFLA